MKYICLIILLIVIQSCASKKFIEKRFFPEGIESMTEETYSIEKTKKRLLEKKHFLFTKNGRVKESKTVDSLGNLLQHTEKKLWFIKESYPEKEPYYCKTRWKTGQRERISCYSRKRYKQNEAIYFYNKNGTIKKIVDNFTTFNTQYFYYTDNQISKIIIKNKDNKILDEVEIDCKEKDEKGACIRQIKSSSITQKCIEIITEIHYKNE